MSLSLGAWRGAGSPGKPFSGLARPVHPGLPSGVRVSGTDGTPPPRRGGLGRPAQGPGIEPEAPRGGGHSALPASLPAAEPGDPHALSGFFYFCFCRRWQILAFSVPFYIPCRLGGEEHRAHQAEAAQTQAAVGREPRREHLRLRWVRFPTRRALGDVTRWAGNVGDVMRWAGEDLLQGCILAT